MVAGPCAGVGGHCAVRQAWVSAPDGSSGSRRAVHLAFTGMSYTLFKFKKSWLFKG